MKLYNKFLIQTYNVGIIKKPIGSIISDGLKRNDICWLVHNYKDRFFADPFLIDEDSDHFFILVEEFIFWEGKGKISLLTVDKKTFRLVEKKTLIEEKTHLSFPFCEYHGNTIIPESVQSHNTVEYTYDREKKEVVSRRVILNEGLIDPCFYTDSNKESWILTSKNKNPKEDLYFYKKSNGKYDPTNEGKPVYKSLRLTRAAGRVFTFGNILYRPVQDCSGRYGRQTIIVQINCISDQAYDVKEIQVVNSFENPPFNETLHTFNVYDDCVIVDGSRDYLRFPMKFFYKKAKWIFK